MPIHLVPKSLWNDQVTPTTTPLTFRGIGPVSPLPESTEDVFGENENVDEDRQDPQAELPETLAERRGKVEAVKSIDTGSAVTQGSNRPVTDSVEQPSPGSEDLRRAVQALVPQESNVDINALIEVFERLRRSDANGAYGAFSLYKKRFQEMLEDQKSKFEREISTLQQSQIAALNVEAGEDDLIDPNNDLEDHWQGEQSISKAEEGGSRPGEAINETADPLTLETGMPGAWPAPLPEKTEELLRCDLRPLANEVQVKQRLLPAIVLLSRHAQLPDKDLASAQEHALSALHLAGQKNVSEVLQARCAYYVGFADFLSQTRVEASSAESPAVDTTRCNPYFEQATVAKGTCDEGQWASEWLAQLESRASLSGFVSRVSKRPESTGSLVSRALSRLSWVIPGRATSTLGNRIPSFGSAHTGDDFSRPTTRDGTRAALEDSAILARVESNTSTTHVEETKQDGWAIQSYPARQSKKTSKYRRANENRPPLYPKHSTDSVVTRTAAVDENDPGLPSTVTSPLSRTTTRKASLACSPKSSPTISSPKAQDEYFGSSSPTGHRRKPSLLSKIVNGGRDRKPSEIDDAEEGHSPFRATFGLLPETSPVNAEFPTNNEMRQRKQSTPEDMV